MNQRGDWSLSPAFDVTYSYNPAGEWTSRHQMSVNGKRDGIVMDDLLDFARFCNLKTARGKEIVAEVVQVLRQWPGIAEEAGIPAARREEMGQHHRLEMWLAPH